MNFGPLKNSGRNPVTILILGWGYLRRSEGYLGPSASDDWHPESRILRTPLIGDAWCNNLFETIMDIRSRSVSIKLRRHRSFLFYLALQIYKTLQQRLQQGHGLERDADQCQFRLKNLRAEFTKRKASLRVSGAGAAKEHPYQSLLEQLFGSRPSSQAASGELGFDLTFQREGTYASCICR